MKKLEIRQFLESDNIQVTNAQLTAGANILGIEDKDDYPDNEAQSIIDYFACGTGKPSQRQNLHTPTQPPTSEQSLGLVQSLELVSGGVTGSTDRLLQARDQFVEDTAMAIAHEIASIPQAIERRVYELLRPVSEGYDAVLFPSLTNASAAFSRPLERQSLAVKGSLKPTDYLQITASMMPH